MDKNELQNLITSNAKAIQAISEALAAEREERRKIESKWDKERSQLYQYLGRIASAQSSFYEVQADYYQQLALMSDRQIQLEERQTKIEEQQVEMQGQIIDILKKLSNSSNT